MISFLPPQTPSALRRQLGLLAVTALVVGDMLGTGIFFTPGDLASVAEWPWQVYFLWGLCGAITLGGALTLAELTTLLPRAGASYHVIREAFGPFPAFVKIWVEMWVSGPGSVAGVAIVLGEFAVRLPMAPPGVSATGWGVLAIAVFALVNLCGVQWGGRTQVVLTVAKVAGLLALVLGSLLLVAPAAPTAAGEAARAQGSSLLGFVRLVGLGVAAVLFTYDGWVDVTHVAGEVKEPARHLPLALGLGVGGLTLLYLLVNFAFLRVVSLDAMRAAPTAVATTVARAAFGPTGGQVLNVLIIVSILGALGGVVMTLPRLYYAAAEQYRDATAGRGVSQFFRALAWVPARSAVPAGSVIFAAALSIAALCFFSTFRRIVTYFVVPLHVVNILLVAAVFRLRRRRGHVPGTYRTPGYPLDPRGLPARLPLPPLRSRTSGAPPRPVSRVPGAARVHVHPDHARGAPRGPPQRGRDRKVAARGGLRRGGTGESRDGPPRDRAGDLPLGRALHGPGRRPLHDLPAASALKVSGLFLGFSRLREQTLASSVGLRRERCERPAMQEAMMERGEREFLAGFERAALLVQQVLACPQAYASGDRYLADVAQLHGDAEDLTRRGLAVGCLAALGRG